MCASVTKQYNLVPVKLGSWEGDCRSGDALAVYHRLCGLSSYWLKAHVREMSTPPELNFGHVPPLGYLYFCLLLTHSVKLLYGWNRYLNMRKIKIRAL